MRTIVIGDVHGCIEQLHGLLDKMSPTREDRIILLGDFVDRGPNSPACLDFAREHEAIIGNHEYKHVRYRDGILRGLSPSQIEAKIQFQKMNKDYDAAVEFMAGLPFYIELPEAVLVHAGVEYGVPMVQQNRIVLVGGMSMRHICGINPATGLPYWCADYPKDAKPVIFGHLKIKGEIPINGNLFPIDTGCCAGGQLTAIVIPEFKVYQVPGWKRPDFY